MPDIASGEFDPRSAIPFGRFMIGGPRAMSFDRFLVRRTGLSIISAQAALVRRAPYAPTLLLETRGRRTGAARCSVLPYVVDGDDLLVVGSNAGGPKDPLWVANLVADPRVWITLRRRRRPAVARLLVGAARAGALEALVSRRAIVADYEQRSRTYGRTMAIVALRTVDHPLDGTEGPTAMNTDHLADDRQARAQLQCLVDRAAITDVLKRYFTAIDKGMDSELMESCFSVDAYASYEGVVAGTNRDELMGYFSGKGNKSPVPMGETLMMMHVLGNAVIDFDDTDDGAPPTEASVESYALAHLIDRVDGRDRMRTRGIGYVDRFVRTDEGWKIRRREHTCRFNVFDALEDDPTP